MGEFVKGVLCLGLAIVIFLLAEVSFDLGRLETGPQRG